MYTGSDFLSFGTFFTAAWPAEVLFLMEGLSEIEFPEFASGASGSFWELPELPEVSHVPQLRATHPHAPGARIT